LIINYTALNIFVSFFYLCERVFLCFFSWRLRLIDFPPTFTGAEGKTDAIGVAAVAFALGNGFKELIEDVIEEAADETVDEVEVFELENGLSALIFGNIDVELCPGLAAPSVGFCLSKKVA